MNPLCAAPGASGEFVLPSLRKLADVTKLVRGLLTRKDFLDEKDVKSVEEVLVLCAKEADQKVNEKYYPEEGYPSDAECNRVVGYGADGNKVTRAMELGKLKHEAAFTCLERELGQRFPDHLTLEPRYGKKPPGEAYTLTEKGHGSLVPDVVLHLVRDANKIQFLYDFLFPCTARSKSDPLGSQRRRLKDKLDKYKNLPGAQQRALVTPQLGISR